MTTAAEKRRLLLERLRFICEHCGSEYTPASTRQHWCKACAPNKQARTRLQRYGVSQEQYDEMLKRQAGRCLICGRMPTRMTVDHDHTTGEVRGLLCNYCNPALNLIENHLQAALTYLGLSPREEGGSTDA